MFAILPTIPAGLSTEIVAHFGLLAPSTHAKMRDGRCKNGPLAQLVEQLTLNQQVRGSSPLRLIANPYVVC